MTFQSLLSTFPVPGPMQVQGGPGHTEVRDTDLALKNGGKDPEIDNHRPDDKGWTRGKVKGSCEF